MTGFDRQKPLEIKKKNFRGGTALSLVHSALNAAKTPLPAKDKEQGARSEPCRAQRARKPFSCRL
jgi:hypothetical protein